MLIRANIMVHPAHLPPNGLVADDIALFQRRFGPAATRTGRGRDEQAKSPRAAALSAATRIRKDYDIADIARYTCRKEEGEGDAERCRARLHGRSWHGVFARADHPDTRLDQRRGAGLSRRAGAHVAPAPALAGGK